MKWPNKKYPNPQINYPPPKSKPNHYSPTGIPIQFQTQTTNPNTPPSQANPSHSQLHNIKSSI